MSKLQSIQNMSGWIHKSVPGDVKVGKLPLRNRNSFGILASRYKLMAALSVNMCITAIITTNKWWLLLLKN